MSRVLLFQLDGKLPNIALMRLAAHHRALGEEVTFRVASIPDEVEPQFGDRFDRVYASAIFRKTRPLADALRKAWPDAIVGGTGWSLTRTLESVGVTTLAQDYSLYPEFEASIGFTQRGCSRRCQFCVVPKIEGAPRHEQTIADIWRGEPYPRQLLLLDNSFFDGPQWRDRVDEIRLGGFRVCFNQGINLRTLTEEQAEILASLDYRDDSFKVRRIYAAWDSVNDEEDVFRGLELLRDASVKPDHLMVYMLVGFEPYETHAQRDYRRKRLREFGARPYPMVFRPSPDRLGYARWVIGAYDKTIPWAEWVEARYQPRNLLRQSGQLELIAEEREST